MDTSSGDSTEKSKFEKVETLAFKKFETVIILCVALAIGAREAAAMSAGQAVETRQIVEEGSQNRQESGTNAAETRSGMENRPVAHDNAVTGRAMTQIARAAAHTSGAADDSTKDADRANHVNRAVEAPHAEGAQRVDLAESAEGTNNAEGADAADAESARADEPMQLPRNLRVPSNMRPTLMRMLQRSATFRRQIATLTRKPAVRVSVAYGGMRGDRHYHALSTVRKHEWGAIVVDTTIYVPTDLVEIIAHELEHVCEQMEGVDLRALAGRRGVGVYDMNGHFETTRAIRAGQNATREYQGGPESSSQQTVNAPY